MTEILTSDDARLYHLGSLVAHSSEDGAGDDLGLSVGLGSGQMLYVGEVPEERGASPALVVYGRGGRPSFTIAAPVDADAARDLIHAIRAAVKGEGM